MGDVDPRCQSTDAMEASVSSKFQGEMQQMFGCVTEMCSTRDGISACTEEELKRQNECILHAFAYYRQTLLLQMRHQPLGTREWMQMFESYMTFACATEHGMGFLNFVLVK